MHPYQTSGVVSRDNSEGKRGASSDDQRMKHLFKSFQTTSTTNSSGKKKSGKKSQLLVKSKSKRDFKVKCMKIDLTKQDLMI